MRNWYISSCYLPFVECSVGLNPKTLFRGWSLANALLTSPPYHFRFSAAAMALNIQDAVWSTQFACVKSRIRALPPHEDPSHAQRAFFLPSSLILYVHTSRIVVDQLHELRPVLVELFKLCLLPAAPIILFDQFSLCEF